MFGVIAIVISTGSAAMERSTAYLQATATAPAYTAIVIGTGSRHGKEQYFLASYSECYWQNSILYGFRQHIPV